MNRYSFSNNVFAPRVKPWDITVMVERIRDNEDSYFLYMQVITTTEEAGLLNAVGRASTNTTT